MKCIEQSSFQPVSTSSIPADESLVVHAHRGNDNDKLLIFVHGLGGDRYGTWGQFPRLIFDTFPQIDIGLYSYRTLFRRTFTRSHSIEHEAEFFGDHIRDDLNKYSNVILFAHSLGGILCYSLIIYLIKSNQKHIIDKLSGLILAGTPQTGSLKVPFFMSWRSYDFKALKAHSDLVTQMLITLTNYVKLNTDKQATADEIVIPTWAMLGQYDLWVDALSARIGLPNSRVRHLQLSHTEIVKPVSEHSPNYIFVAGCLKKVLDRIAEKNEELVGEASRGALTDLSQAQLPAPSDKELSDWVRAAVDAAERATAIGDDATFEGPEGIGKSTALAEFLARSRKSGKRTALIHLSAFSHADLELNELFWLCLANSLREFLQNTTKMEIEKPFEKLRNQSGFINYVCHVLPEELYPIVIGIEEVGRLRGRPVEDDFHRMRRVLIDRERGSTGPRRVQFALCGIEVAKALRMPDDRESRLAPREYRLMRSPGKLDDIS